MNLSEDQILALAPDEASKKAGLGLANPGKWVSKGANELAIWGECQGSGSKPYQAQIDLQQIAFKCSCPSRKFPCKHGLGLFILYARQTNQFKQEPAPAWVTEWLEKRAQKEEKKAARADTPVDEAAQAKRQASRHDAVLNGISELKKWMSDIIRNGIIAMPDKGFSFFENMAKRMVDAKAPGLANMIRNLGETPFYQENWQQTFLEKLLGIYLVSEGYSTQHDKEHVFVQDLRSWIGYTINQDELKEQAGITDEWLVLAKQSSEVDSVTTEKYWLYGTTSKAYAVVLQFIVRGQGTVLTLSAGMTIRAELVFFPSVNPLRALIKRQINTEQLTSLSGYPHWNAVLETTATLYSQFPVQGERAWFVNDLVPVYHNQQWWFRDSDAQLMPAGNNEQKIWKILAISGGKPTGLSLISNNHRFEPAGIWSGNEYLPL